MPEEYLQTAFEIKTACDEISRRLLRWHWEQKPGAHSMDALLAYIEQRKLESPEYYEHLPELSGKASWQQLDTTLCMRVLLDPEKDASRPLDMLGNTAHPAAAHRACNAVRTARNEAAHASDQQGAAQAALLYTEAIEALEDGYANSAFTEFELSTYYRQAEEFSARLSAKPGRAASRQSSAAARAESSTALAPVPKQRSGASQRNGGRSTAKGGRSSKSQAKRGVNWPLVIILLLAIAVGLAMRASSMGVV